MNTEQLTYRSKRDEREKSKEQERRKIGRGRFFRKFKIYAIWFLIIIAVGYGVYLAMKNTAPRGEDFSKHIPVMENSNHVPAEADKTIEYNSNPPTSGPHYGSTAKSGFRDEMIPDGHIIHNLEHGDIWIAYHPRIANSIKEELKQFSAAKVIIAAREANETDIALAAWGRLDTFDIENNQLPVGRVKDFIKRYANQGPEKVPGASGGI